MTGGCRDDGGCEVPACAGMTEVWGWRGWLRANGSPPPRFAALARPLPQTGGGGTAALSRRCEVPACAGMTEVWGWRGWLRANGSPPPRFAALARPLPQTGGGGTAALSRRCEVPACAGMTAGRGNDGRSQPFPKWGMTSSAKRESCSLNSSAGMPSGQRNITWSRPGNSAS